MGVSHPARLEKGRDKIKERGANTAEWNIKQSWHVGRYTHKIRNKSAEKLKWKSAWLTRRIANKNFIALTNIYDGDFAKKAALHFHAINMGYVWNKELR